MRLRGCDEWWSEFQWPPVIQSIGLHENCTPAPFSTDETVSPCDTATTVTSVFAWVTQLLTAVTQDGQVPARLGDATHRIDNTDLRTVKKTNRYENIIPKLTQCDGPLNADPIWKALV